MNKLNILKRIILTLFGLIIFLSGVMYGSYKCNASSELTTSDYESIIKNNEVEIQQCEAIKESLHATAQEIRKQNFYDTSFVDSLSAKWHSQDKYQNSLRLENENLKRKIKDLETKHIYIGDFTITHYCTENYRHICNNGNAFTTATGAVPTPGRTIAVDPRKIPYGTKVVVDGHTYIAEDCGGAIKGNKLDICVATHSEARQKGVRRNVPVYIIKE